MYQETKDCGSNVTYIFSLFFFLEIYFILVFSSPVNFLEVFCFGEIKDAEEKEGGNGMGYDSKKLREHNCKKEKICKRIKKPEFLG